MRNVDPTFLKIRIQIQPKGPDPQHSFFSRTLCRPVCLLYDGRAGFPMDFRADIFMSPTVTLDRQGDTFEKQSFQSQKVKDRHLKFKLN